MDASSPAKLTAVSTAQRLLMPSPLPVRIVVPEDKPTVEELQAEVQRLRKLLAEKEGSEKGSRRGSRVDMYGRLRPFALPEPPSVMRPPHLSWVHESPKVRSFLEHLLKPIAVRESVVLFRGCGFSTTENGGLPVKVKDVEIPLFDIETSVRGCLELRNTFEVLRRGRPGQHIDSAVTPHSLEVVLHSVLMARPWLQVAGLDKTLRYTTKCPTQGPVHELALLFWEEEAGVMKRYQSTPGATLFWRVGESSILALPSEHNGFNDESDYKRARTMALLGFHTLAGIIGNASEVVVPFLTLNGSHIQLHVISQVPDENSPSVFSHPQWSWSVEQPGRALACLACMYRLVEWLSEVGSKLTLDSVAPLASMAIKHLQHGFLTSKPVPQDAVRVLRDHYGQIEDVVANGRHFMTSSGTWVKIYLSQADGTVEARVLSDLASLGFKAAPKLIAQWLLPHDCLAVEMEHCGQSLRKIETWPELAKRMLELATILRELHSLSWVHGDLKEGNICLDAHGQVRIIDWEGAVSGGQRPVYWTDTYRAPETLYLEYSSKSDIYSVGVILERWLGRLPESDDENLIHFWTKLKADMLVDDIEARLDASALIARLESGKRTIGL